ncbi:MAG: ligand-binding protein SH3 [Candidatus Omnitrophota bacterium]|jgi:uncharacterized membrane protein|nr:MAG: ligand-binding protein SH3 [Candidatus Omnitrophota bacterium]
MTNEIKVLILAALPVSELRGAIPLGLSFNLPLIKVFWISIIGNLLPVIPLLLLLEPVSARLRKFALWKNFFDWLFERTKKKSELIQKYESIGLMLFVAVPLPMTGAWTGAIAASLFKIRFKYAFISIAAGVLIAGVIVSILCTLGISGYKILTK